MRFKEFLAAGLLLLTFPVAVQAGDYTYTTNNGMITITAYAGSGGAVTIPDTITGLPVTIIGSHAFYNCTNLTSVTMGTNLTSIGSDAFLSCTALTNVTIGPNVASIGDFAFYSCTALTSVTMSVNVTNIGDYVFMFCSKLTSIMIPDHVTSIGCSAFSRCTSLTSVTIGPNVISIGDYAFQSCSKLTVVTIPDRVTSIGDYAFQSCAKLANVTMGTNLTSIGRSAFLNCTALTSVTIGPNVTSIGSYAFQSCANLPGIMIPDRVTSIEISTFNNCTNLTNVTIGTNVTSIGSYAFQSCPKLTVVTIPDRVTSIGNEVFSDCASLASITIPDRVTSIGSGAFFKCTSLTSILIGNSVTSIGDCAFQSCAKLANVTMGTNLTSIGSSAFLSCTALTNVTIGHNVTNIGFEAFLSCASLMSITVDGSNSFYGSVDGSLFNKSQTRFIQYPAGKAGEYTLPNGVTNIGNSAFRNCAKLTSITIPNSVTSIGDSAFETCASLTGVYFKGNAPGLGASVFYNADMATLYRASGAVGWPVVPNVWGGRPTALWDPLYFLVVTSGVGGGSYTNGTRVSITASNAPTGKTFDRWTGDTQYVASVIFPMTVTTMPMRDVVLTATYKDVYCTITVASAHGTPVPSFGSNSYVWGSSVICSVPSSVIEQGINWRNTGWTGTGDIPTSGSSNTTGNLVLTNVSSAITWNWGTAFAITNLTAVQRPGTKLVDITYDLISDVTNAVPVSLVVQNNGLVVATTSLTGSIGAAVPPGTGRQITWNAGADWNGNVANLSFAVKHSGFAFAASNSAAVNTRDYTLTVNGGSGGGIYNYQQQVEIGATLPSDWFRFVRWDGATQYVSSATAPTATVTMPAGNISLTAAFTNLYTINANNTVTLTGYSGAGGVVFLPDTLEGRPVTGIANLAFYQNTAITHVTVPATVTNIGVRAFSECPNLKGIYFLGNPPSLGANAFKDSPQVTVYYYPGSTGWLATYGGCPAVLLPYLYTMQNGEVTITEYKGNAVLIEIPSIINGLPVTGIGNWSFYGLENLTGVMIPSSVTWIGEWAFGDCINLSGVVIPHSVTNISDGAFSGCGSLQQITFRGDAPGVSGNPFANCPATVFYRLGSSGWGGSFSGLTPKMWNPAIRSAEATFGMRPSGFGFSVRGDEGTPVIVEAATNLTGGVWIAIETNVITAGVFNFSDPQATNTPGRFYRLRMP